MLIGVRRMMKTGEGPEVVYEYRLDSFGNVVQTAGKPRKNDDVYLTPLCNIVGPSIAQQYGMEWKSIALKDSRTVTRAAGREFLIALLVKYARSGGYSYMEPIEA